MLIQKAASIVLGEDSCEPPRLFLHGLHILDLDQQDVARFRGLNLERTSQIMHAAKIHVLDIVG